MCDPVAKVAFFWVGLGGGLFEGTVVGSDGLAFQKLGGNWDTGAPYKSVYNPTPPKVKN